MSSPYQKLPSRNFWKTGVTNQHPLTIANLYKKKFSIEPGTKIATAGSCFAQHIARHMRSHGFQVLDVEPAPPGLSSKQLREYGFGLYSARYGNIYLVRQLLQLAQEAFGNYSPQAAVWEKNGKYYDAIRPTVEPNGLATPDEVNTHRTHHIARVRKLFETMDLFVFTLGLTEGWVHTPSGTVYPTAPGTLAGSFKPGLMHFHNFTYSEILADFRAFKDLIKAHNPSVKFLLTVSPVPLTATAENEHVLSATTYSKSVLRAVAGELYKTFNDVDYFPSYEIIASPFSRGFFFEPNLRTVSDAGVKSVMRVFFDEHGPTITKNSEQKTTQKSSSISSEGDTVCEDALLEAFAKP